MNRWRQLLASKHVRLPIGLAPMAGVSTPKLVSAVARAGGVSFHGAGFRTAQQLQADLDEIKSMLGAEHAWGVNVFAHSPLGEAEQSESTQRRVETARTRLAPFYAAAGLAPETDVPKQPKEQHLLAEQLEVLFEPRNWVPAISFCFGILNKLTIQKFQKQGTAVIGTATSVREALELQAAGCDAVVCQGSEAGGHRGSFLPESTAIGTLALVPQVRDALDRNTAVIAAGGIMDARGVQASLTLGADFCLLGTAFLRCEESGAPSAYKAALATACDTDPVLTDVFSGRTARGLQNLMTREYAVDLKADRNLAGALNDAVAPYPLQQSLNAPLKKQGNAELMSLWAGQGVTLAREGTAAEVLDRISRDAKELRDATTQVWSRL